MADARLLGIMPRRIRRPHPAEFVLALLMLAGVTLRIVALASWSPATTVITDSGDYAYSAATNPLASPQHSAGYSVVLAFIGLFSRDITVTIILQCLAGVVSSLVMYATVRRLTGSPWPGLLPAGVILLNADEAFLEHTIMSEVWFVLALAAMFYAAVRAMDPQAPCWRWPAAAAVLASLATVVRAAALFVVPVIAMVVLLSASRPWRARWRAPAAVLGVAGALLLGFAYMNLVSNGRLAVGPAQGWYLYGRVAPFADCHKFNPPKGTERLCETSAPASRPAEAAYLYYPVSPAWRLWGPQPWKHHDSDMRAWALAAIRAQPGDYALDIWRALRAWYLPSQRPTRFLEVGNLDPELDWSLTTRSGGVQRSVFKWVETLVGRRLVTFFHPFSVRKSDGGLAFLHGYQRVFRFGATALCIATLLCLIGLLVGTRRSRLGVLLFGVGGTALLVVPVLTIGYVGRYSVPLAGPITAGSAVALWALWRMRAGRRSAEAPPPTPAAPLEASREPRKRWRHRSMWQSRTSWGGDDRDVDG